MADTSNVSLLACFAEFYEEIARVKLAIREGRLPIYLGNGKEPASFSGADLAAMVSQCLKGRLQHQGKTIRKSGTEAEIASYRVAQYAMAALADELFILDIDWPGREAWAQYPLEQSLFGSSRAGCNVFCDIDALLASRAQTPLQEDLAAVLLMTLRLGFKGQHRGASGAPALKSYREKLMQFLGAAHATLSNRPACMQAYRHRASEPRAQRLAPLSRWYYVAAVALAVYLVLSTGVWVHATHRFSDVFAMAGE